MFGNNFHCHPLCTGWVEIEFFQPRHSLPIGELKPLTEKFPRTRFNRAPGVKRSFSTCQLSLDEHKELKNALGVTLNDVVLAVLAVLAVVAGAVRSYLLFHDELPDSPLATSVPVGADDTGEISRMGNKTSALFTMLHPEIEDPLEQFYAIKKNTEQGKEGLAVFGKHSGAI